MSDWGPTILVALVCERPPVNTKRETGFALSKMQRFKPAMKTQPFHTDHSELATSIAPEDLRPGDFVAVLNQLMEVPSFYWTESFFRERDEVVRFRIVPTGERTPLKVKAICLPFVFVKMPCGGFQTLDIRVTQLARLDEQYARTVWKVLKPAPPKAAVTS